MFHWFGVVQNNRGDALASWQVGLVNVDTQDVVSIFADESSTPIVSVSGVANRAIADENGNYDFFVPSGNYTLQFFNGSGVFQRSQRFVAMFGDDYATDSIASTADSAAAAALSASAAAALSGPFYVTTAEGLAATTDGQEFNVRANLTDPTADVYLNSEGTAVFSRTFIIAPDAPGTAALIGTTAGDLQTVLDAIEARLTALEP